MAQARIQDFAQGGATAEKGPEVSQKGPHSDCLSWRVKIRQCRKNSKFTIEFGIVNENALSCVSRP